jgi:hypothetical protein
MMRLTRATWREDGRLLVLRWVCPDGRTRWETICMAPQSGPGAVRSLARLKHLAASAGFDLDDGLDLDRLLGARCHESDLGVRLTDTPHFPQRATGLRPQVSRRYAWRAVRKFQPGS